MSETTPPTIVEKVEPPTPTRKRTTSIPAYECAKPVHSWQMTNRMPEARNTGRRPLISENGANTIGATAKPRWIVNYHSLVDMDSRSGNIPDVKVVMPTKTATLLTPHSADICATPGLYDPAA